MNFAPSDSICSLTAGRTSEASITAPRRLAVAIACRPATPAPRINTRAAFTVPAAVIIIGINRPYSDGCHQHRLVAGDVGLRRQHVHALRARGARRGFERERGQPRRVHRRDAVVVERLEHADDDRAALHLRELGTLRRAHLQHGLRTERIVGAADSSRPPRRTPRLENSHWRPRPTATTTLCLAATSFLTVSGVAATRVSPALPSAGTPMFIQRCLRLFL